MIGGKRGAIAVAVLGVLVAVPLAIAAKQDEERAVALLREAASAERRGDLANAARGYERAAAFAPVAAPARLLAARAWLAAKQPASAADAAQAGIDAGAGAPWRGDLFEARARARLDAGDDAGAERAFREALDAGLDGDRLYDAKLELAQLLGARGEREAEASMLVAVWIDAAGRPPGDRAGDRIAAREKATGRALRSNADWIARADRLYAAFRNQAALAAYDAALARKPSGAERARAQRGRGDALFRLRRYADAARAFAASSEPEARIWYGRSLARAGRVDEGIAALESMPETTPPRIQAWGHFLAGTLHEGRGRDRQAHALYRSAVRDADADVAADALWRLGFGAYRQRDFAEAREHLVALVARESDPIDRLTARYWAARALERVEPKPGAAAAELASIAREYPFSYYGVRAAERLGARAPKPAATTPLADGPAKIAPSELVAARVLARAGLERTAQRASASLAERATTYPDRLAVARLFSAAGELNRAQLLLIKSYGERLAQGPWPGGDEMWRIAWPDAYAKERRAALSGHSQLPRWLVPALMREESGYRRDAVSPAGALGLMQLMPDTARRLAGRAGLDYARQRLFDPAYNVRLGVLFLEQLSKRFGGRTEAICAAYNAGPGAVDDWRAAPIGDEVEWVEAIPYDETRGYVKRIVRSMHIYETLYP